MSFWLNQSENTAVEPTDSVAKNFLEPNAFTIRDLTSLLKNLETEISLNEMNLNDENDKRFMFKVNPHRRNTPKMCLKTNSFRSTTVAAPTTTTSSSARSCRCWPTRERWPSSSPNRFRANQATAWDRPSPTTERISRVSTRRVAAAVIAPKKRAENDAKVETSTRRNEQI